jgi:hypothetical protein
MGGEWRSGRRDGRKGRGGGRNGACEDRSGRCGRRRGRCGNRRGRCGKRRGRWERRSRWWGERRGTCVGLGRDSEGFPGGPDSQQLAARLFRWADIKPESSKLSRGKFGPGGKRAEPPLSADWEIRRQDVSRGGGVSPQMVVRASRPNLECWRRDASPTVWSETLQPLVTLSGFPQNLASASSDGPGSGANCVSRRVYQNLVVTHAGYREGASLIFSPSRCPAMSGNQLAKDPLPIGTGNLLRG